MHAAPRQLPLALDLPVSSARADLVEDSSNAAALAWLDRPEDWPAGRLALHGPPGVGKSHALAATAAARGWRLLRGPELRRREALDPGAPDTVVDDADCVAEETALLHLLNASAERGARVLLSGRDPPARWPVRLPDLASRLRAIHAVAIGPPSDALLGALLAKLFADRQLRVEPGMQSWLLARLPREAAALAEATARLDRAALAHGGAVNRALARQALAGWEGFGPDDSSGSQGPGTSPGLPRLL
jgi:chromosomal replication initiation ATPase DnaA